MILLQARTRLFVGVFWVVLILALLPCPVYASTQEAGTLPLTISNVTATSITQTSATISWNTNGNGTSQVFYDTAWHNTTAEYADNTTEDTAPVTEHSVLLTGLSEETTYHYRVRSAAIPDTEFITISEDRTFKTLTPAVGAGGGAAPTYYIETDLFGTKAWLPISYSGKVRKTIEATSQDGMLAFTIPSGTVALGKDGKRLKSLQTAVDESPAEPPEDTHVIGLAYDFGPDGATFDPPITLTWSYDPADIPEGVAEEDLVLAYYDEDADEWVELDCVVDTENNTITASVEHFTSFAILGAVTLEVEVEEIAELEKTIRELETRVASLRGDYDTAKSAIAAAQAKLASAHGDYDTAKSAVAAAQAKVASAQGDYDTAKSSVAAVQARVASLQTALADRQERLAEAETRVAELEAAAPNWALIGGIIAGVVAVAFVVFYLVSSKPGVNTVVSKRRKKNIPPR